MQDLTAFNQGLLSFLDRSPTPFHAVETICQVLLAAGFEQLSEADDWQTTAYGRYFVVRNGSSIVAFSLGAESPVKTGFRMLGAHTDSPCLKVKPNPELYKQGYFQLGVEVYGGALLNPWFDRDLSLAGRLSYCDSQGQVRSALIDFARPIATIPSLAIHLDCEANKNRSINPQKDIPPLLMQVEAGGDDFRQLLAARLREEQPELDVSNVLDYELSFYDSQPAAIIGLNNEFVSSARLDNLLSCYVGLQALLEAGDHNCLLVCNDHEEVGSQSAAGAQGTLLKSVLQRVVGDAGDFARCMDRSMLVSADNAHAIHPNYADRHDDNHGPKINAGPVIKLNANQRYATNSETSAIFRQFCEQADVPVQAFVVRSDMACGSTIGPLTAGEIGAKTIDVGVPTFAMHSIRELAGSYDAHHLYRVMCAFNQAAHVSVVPQ